MFYEKGIIENIGCCFVKLLISDNNALSSLAYKLEIEKIYVSYLNKSNSLPQK